MPKFVQFWSQYITNHISPQSPYQNASKIENGLIHPHPSHCWIKFPMENEIKTRDLHHWESRNNSDSNSNKFQLFLFLEKLIPIHSFWQEIFNFYHHLFSLFTIYIHHTLYIFSPHTNLWWKLFPTIHLWWIIFPHARMRFHIIRVLYSIVLYNKNSRDQE